MDVMAAVMLDAVGHVAHYAREHAQERAKIYVLEAAPERAKLSVQVLVAMDVQGAV